MEIFSSEESNFQKFIWIFVLISVSLLSLIVLYLNLLQYLGSTTRTSIESTTSSLRSIIFPSVYICNVNQEWRLCYKITYLFKTAKVAKTYQRLAI